jgi:pyruvate dehydrogenase E1 component
MSRFREETIGGLPSYPHPWLMPGFWQFPTVSMGLTSISAIYQARFMKYLPAATRRRPGRPVRARWARG